MRKLFNVESPRQIRGLAIRSSGIYLSVFLLVDARTGRKKNVHILRASLAESHRRGPSGVFERLRQSIFLFFWSKESDRDPRIDEFESLMRVGLAQRNQRRVTLAGGRGALAAPLLGHVDLNRFRSQLMISDERMKGPGAVLVFFDSTGRARKSKEAILAALDAIASVYG